MAAIVEGCGYDGAWMGDHVVMVEGAASRYPYSRDGVLGPADEEWYDWVVVLSALVGSTSSLRLGVAVSVPALRNPLVLAKQLATLDRLSGGRLVFGVGTGWFSEEFAALGVPFSGRGARTDGLLALSRAAWTGAPEPGDYGPFCIPAGVRVHPTPLQSPLPILIAGDGLASLRRAIQYGQGWITVADPKLTPVDIVLERIARYRETSSDLGQPDSSHVVLRVPARPSMVGVELHDYLQAVVAGGATGLIFDVNWSRPDGASETLDRLGTILDDLPSPRPTTVDLGRESTAIIRKQLAP